MEDGLYHYYAHHVLFHVEDLLLCTNYIATLHAIRLLATDKLPNHHFTLLHNSQSLYSGLQALRLASRDHLMCMMALACRSQWLGGGARVRVVGNDRQQAT